MKLSLFSIFHIRLFVALALTGCSAKNDIGTIRWWHFWSEPYQKATITELIREFEEQNPTLHIEAGELTWQSGHDKIATSFASDRGPDVVELGSDWVYEFASRGVLKDVTPVADSLNAQFQGWAPAKVNGQYFAFPWLLGSRAMFVNSALVADSIASWDDLLTAVQKAHHPSEGRYGFGNTKREPHQLYKKVLPFFWSNGGDVLDSSGQVVVNSPKNVEALEFYLRLGKLGLMESQKILDDRFTEGKLGVVISGGWLIRKIEQQNPDLQYRIELMPSPVTGVPGISFYGGEYLAISRNCANPDAAMKWVQFLLDHRHAKRICDLTKVTQPAAIDTSRLLHVETPPAVAMLVKQLSLSRSSPLHPHWTEMERALEDEIEQALYGNKTAREALQQAQERIDKIIRP